MAQATLNATVVLGGKVDNSFTRIGSILSTMGNTINGVSRQLIDFGKKSIDVYRNYEDSMLDTEVALSTIYGRDTRELSAVMQQLDAQATEWAASSIFHTNDVGNAIAQAAHANWDLEKILEGIPAAMELAQAGGLDLSQAIDYIVKSTNAMGLEFKDVGSFIDEWVFAANSSAGSVETFGDAMVRMGKTMTFSQNREELLSMIAVLHDAGATGSEAGTLLRNTMIRLVAPTDKAEEAMAALKLTQADVDEAMREVDGDTEAAMKTLQKMGFSAYDKNGNLKSFLEIFRDLSLVTEKMTEEERNDVISALFPTRTITGALALLDEFKDGTSDLYQAMRRGDAENYGQFGAETMMSGLTGAIETLASKWERLQQVTGESLSGDVEAFAGWAGGFIDKVAMLPEGQLDMLVGGLEGIALSGPGLIVAGKAFELVGTALGSNTGRIVLAAVAISALVGAMRAYEEVSFEDKFGNLELDMGPIQNYVDNVTKPFNNARADLEAYKKAVQDAIQQYTDSSTELSSGLITKMTTGVKLTDIDKAKFENLGDSMYQSVQDGIQAAYIADAERFSLAAGEDVSNPLFANILDVLETGYQSAIDKANTLNEELRNALTGAFDDGILDENELSNIQEYMQQMNELLAIETDTVRFAEQQRQLRKAQTLGIDNAQQIADMVSASRDTQLDYIYDDYANMMGRVEALEKTGLLVNDPDRLDDEYDQMVQWIEDSTARRTGEVNDAYNGQLMRTFENTIRTSDVGDLYASMKDTLNEVRAGTVTAQQAYTTLAGQYSGSDLATVARALEIEINALGGASKVSEQEQYYRGIGDTENARRYSELFTLWSIATQGGELMRNATGSDIESTMVERYDAQRRDIDATREGIRSGQIDTANIEYFMAQLANPDSMEYANDLWAKSAGLSNDERENLLMWTEAASQMYDLNEVFANSPLAQTGGAAGFESYQDVYAAWQLLNMSGADASQYAIGTGQPSGMTPNQYLEQGAVSLSAQGPVETDVTFNTDQASTAKSQIDSTVGAPVSVSVEFPNAGSAAAAAAAEVESAFPETMSVNVRVNATTSGMPSAGAAAVPSKGMAEGGRADEPVVFGEAGPEWFIPEGHTRRTAELLMQAAEASGYHWSDLAAMSGARMFADGGVIGHSEFAAFSGDAIPELDWGELTPVGYGDGGSEGDSASPVQVQYSPVINAENADGVDEVLQQDKDRLRQMLEELIEERDLIESVRAYR